MDKSGRAGRRAGFTLIELMIVVAIIGILAAIAIPKFSDLLRKSNEGSTKGNLGALRSALSIYYGDMEGLFPSDNLSSLTAGGKYINVIPAVQTTPHHPKTSRVGYTGNMGYAGLWWLDDGRWAYWNDPDAAMAQSPRSWGDVWVGCHHTDTKSTKWTMY